MDNVTITTPLSAVVCHARLGLAIINLCIIFEASVFSHYENRKGVVKSREWGGLE